MTEDRCAVLQEKNKKKNLRISICCRDERDLTPHTSQQGNHGLIPIEQEKQTNLREYKNHKCIRVKIFKIKLVACKNQGLNNHNLPTLFEIKPGFQNFYTRNFKFTQFISNQGYKNQDSNEIELLYIDFTNFNTTKSIGF